MDDPAFGSGAGAAAAGRRSAAGGPGRTGAVATGVTVAWRP